MNVELRRRIDELEQQLGAMAVENADLRSELGIAWERQAVTAQILNVISMSRTDVHPFFDVISESSRRLLGGQTALVTRVLGGMLHLAACTTGSRASHREIRASFPAPFRERWKQKALTSGPHVSALMQAPRWSAISAATASSISPPTATQSTPRRG